MAKSVCKKLLILDDTSRVDDIVEGQFQFFALRLINLSLSNKSLTLNDLKMGKRKFHKSVINKTPVVFIFIFAICESVFGGTIQYIWDIDDLEGLYVAPVSASYWGTHRESTYDFGVPITNVESFTIEFSGDIELPTYEDLQGETFEGRILYNLNIGDVGPNSLGCFTIALGYYLISDSYHKELFNDNGVFHISDYVVDSNSFYYSITMNNNHPYNWDIGFSSGIVNVWFHIFNHPQFDHQPGSLIKAGSVYLTDFKLTVSAIPEPASLILLAFGMLLARRKKNLSSTQKSTKHLSESCVLCGKKNSINLCRSAQSVLKNEPPAASERVQISLQPPPTLHLQYKTGLQVVTLQPHFVLYI